MGLGVPTGEHTPIAEESGNPWLTDAKLITEERRYPLLSDPNHNTKEQRHQLLRVPSLITEERGQGAPTGSFTHCWGEGAPIFEGSLNHHLGEGTPIAEGTEEPTGLPRPPLHCPERDWGGVGAPPGGLPCSCPASGGSPGWTVRRQTLAPAPIKGNGGVSQSRRLLPARSHLRAAGGRAGTEPPSRTRALAGDEPRRAAGLALTPAPPPAPAPARPGPCRLQQRERPGTRRRGPPAFPGER